MNLYPEQVYGQMAQSVEDAGRAFGDSFRRPSFYMYTKMWPSGGCGFPGMAVASSTTALTVVVVNAYCNVRVYHGGRFAYEVERPNVLFWEHLQNYCLEGQTSYEGQYERRIENEKGNQ